VTARRIFRLPFDPTAALTHTDLVRMIVQYLRTRQWFVVQTPRGGIAGVPGFPDVIAFKASRVMLVEAKVGEDKLDYYQLRMKVSLECAGFAVIEARSLEDVMDEGA
jgi:hypothetical protein